ncbi:MAG: 5-methylcytosine-specific restriction endonuclease system specificity protein McrC [Lactobacillus amylovorus]|uniref:5-methylcytosine-specific restriction endonuclease system specificity protein McrC n=1 Tax=Ruoffia sp. FAM 26254 TaxID=3259518 RepID=UPI00388B131B
MLKYKNSFIQNIYYMLCYAFKVLQQTNYEEVESESFDNIYDLFAEILIKGLNKQLKQGLHKEYVEKHKNLATIRGKVNLRDSLANKMQRKQLLVCEYDELSEDNSLNQILKVTMILLLKEPSVKKEKKAKMRKLMLYFANISIINPRQIKWQNLQFQRNNQTYRMLINICKFIIDGLLLSTEAGTYKTPTFSDENIEMLFERFVLEYYKYHYPHLKVHRPHVKWNLVGEDFNEGMTFLPQMKTDIKLSYQEKSLIIDTKFYGQILSDFEKYKSINLYQIFSYVKNEDVNRTGNVSGMLLYAKTDETKNIEYSFNMDGNRIGVRTLDLGQEFIGIKGQLDGIVGEYFGLELYLK